MEEATIVYLGLLLALGLVVWGILTLLDRRRARRALRTLDLRHRK